MLSCSSESIGPATKQDWPSQYWAQEHVGRAARPHLACLILNEVRVDIVEEGVDGDVSAQGVLKGCPEFLGWVCIQRAGGEASPANDGRRTTLVGIREPELELPSSPLAFECAPPPSAYSSLRSCTRSISSPPTVMRAVSRCLLWSGFAWIFAIRVLCMSALSPAGPSGRSRSAWRYPSRSVAKWCPVSDEMQMSRSSDSRPRSCHREGDGRAEC